MSTQKIYAVKVDDGWIGMMDADGVSRPVLDPTGEPEVFSHQVEAIAVAGMVLSKEIAANA
jgi:hypothetical protein